MTFYERYLNGNKNECIGDYIEEWKRIGSRKELHEYLGISFEALMCVFNYPDDIEGIMKSRDLFHDYPVKEIIIPPSAKRIWKDYRKCPDCDETMHIRSGYIMHTVIGNIYVEGKYHYCINCGHEQFSKNMKYKMNLVLEEKKKLWCTEGIMSYQKYPDKYISIRDFASSIGVTEKMLDDNLKFNEQSIYFYLNGIKIYFMNNLKQIYELNR